MNKRKAASRGKTTRPRPARRRRNWTRVVESTTVGRMPGGAAAAHEAFRGLPAREQREIARELVYTRQAEITRAYADIIAVSAGHRLSRDRAGVRHVQPEVCIIVVVKKKWPRGARGSSARRVPSHFFTYCTIDGRRVPCAIATDVEDARRLAGLRPQSQIQVNKNSRTDRGAIACAVHRGNTEVWAISCRHVFGLALLLGADGDPGGAAISLDASGGEIGDGSSDAGPLVNAPAESFDGQIARVSNQDNLFEALDRFAVREFVQDLEQGVDYWIQTPDGKIKAHYVGDYTLPVRYTAKLDAVLHHELAQFHLPESVTKAGHSGAPVLTEEAGGKLVGMHIIGDEAERISLVIPAWRLLDPEGYGVSGEQWQLWPGP